MNYRACTGPCGETKPATTEYFYRAKMGKYGLRSRCKVCWNESARNRKSELNTDPNIKKTCTGPCGKTLPATTEYFHKQKCGKYGLRSQCKVCNCELSKNWAKNNPDKKRAKDHRRRKRKSNAEGDHTAQDVKRIRRKQDNKCLYCGCVLLSNYHVDHFVPLSRGGKNSADNLAIACPHCNCSKNSTVPEEWNNWNGQFPVEWKEAVHFVCWLQ